MKTNIAALGLLVLSACTAEVPVTDGLNGVGGASNTSGVAGATNPAATTGATATSDGTGTNASVGTGDTTITTDATVTSTTNKSTPTGSAEATFVAQFVPMCRQICQTIVTCPTAYEKSCSCDAESSAGSPNVSTEVPSSSGAGVSAAVGGVAGSSAQSPSTSSAASSDVGDSPSCTCSTSSYLHLDTCLGDCMSAFGPRFLYKGEDCAKTGMALLSCYAKLDCSAFANSQKDPCETPVTTALCPKTNNQDSATADVSPTTSRPCVTGGSSGRAGVVDLASLAPNTQICDASFGICDGAPTYGVSCKTLEDLSIECQCLVNGRLQSTFDGRAMLEAHPQMYTCNDVAWLNPACGWSLSQ